MARPQSSDYDERRAAILEAAATHFAVHGFHAASMSDIAQACGVSKSAMYHYFASKQDILFAVMDDYVERLRARVEAAAHGPDSPEARLRAVVRSALQLYGGARDRHIVLLNELPALAPDEKAQIVSVQTDIIACYKRLLTELQPNLASQTGRQSAAAMAFLGMINWTYTWFNPDGPLTMEAFGDMAVDLLLHGLLRGTSGTAMSATAQSKSISEYG